MTLTLRLAWRNIWRNRRRSVLSLLAIVMATAVIIFFRSIQISAWGTSVDTAVNVFEGAFQLQLDGYIQKKKMELSFEPNTELLRKLSEDEAIKGVSVRALGFALASSADRSYGVAVIGVLPQTEGSVSTIPGLIKQGQFLSAPDAQEVVLGETLARNLKVGLNSEITLLGQGRDGSTAATVLTVAGIFSSGSLDLDRAMIEVPLTTFQDVFSMGQSVHTVVGTVKDIQALPITLKRVQQIVGTHPSETFAGKSLNVLSWDDVMPGLRQAIDLDLSAAWLFFFSLIFVVTFSILNTFLMSVVERTREFGVMLALGIRRRSIAKIVLTEAVLLTLFGTFLGMVLGSLVVAYFYANGFAIPGAEEIARTWNMPSIIFPQLSLDSLLKGPALLFVCCLLASIYPLIRATAVEPVKALKL